MQVFQPDTSGAVTIEAKDNHFINCCATTLGAGAYNSAIAITPGVCVFNRIAIEGNSAVACKTYLWLISDVALTINGLSSYGNDIDASMKQTGYIGWTKPILAAGHIQMQHIDNMPAEPNVRASVGSIITDATKGIRWERIGIGESRVGWAARIIGSAPPPLITGRSDRA